MVDIFGFSVSVSFQELIVLAVILAAFLVITRKIVKTIFNMIWISVASAIFPFIMRFLGFDFSTDFNSVLFFVVFGIGLYAVYMLARIVYVLLGVVEKIGRGATYPLRSARKSKENKMKKKMEKFIKEKEGKRKEKE